MEDVNYVSQHANLFSRSFFGRSGGTWKKGSVLKSEGGRSVSSGSPHDLAVVEVCSRLLSNAANCNARCDTGMF